MLMSIGHQLGLNHYFTERNTMTKKNRSELANTMPIAIGINCNSKQAQECLLALQAIY